MLWLTRKMRLSNKLFLRLFICMKWSGSVFLVFILWSAEGEGRLFLWHHSGSCSPEKNKGLKFMKGDLGNVRSVREWLGGLTRCGGTLGELVSAFMHYSPPPLSSSPLYSPLVKRDPKSLLDSEPPKTHETRKKSRTVKLLLVTPPLPSDR